MKRLILSILTVLALTATIAVAQNPQNTTAPGPTTQQQPGETNNNLPNPGNPQTQVGNQDNAPLQEEGSTAADTTATSMSEDQGSTTGTTTGTMTQGTTSLQNDQDPDNEGAVDVDVDTGANAEGAVDVDVSQTPDADTSASGVDETGTETGTYSDTDALPDTASELPTVALIGLIALAAAFALRVVRRNA